MRRLAASDTEVRGSPRGGQCCIWRQRNIKCDFEFDLGSCRKADVVADGEYELRQYADGADECASERGIGILNGEAGNLSGRTHLTVRVETEEMRDAQKYYT